MSMKNNNMDKFLRGSLDNLEVHPSQNVWKSISKRLLILEVIRLNFTNVGKFWLYSGLATLTTIAGISYYANTQDQTTEAVHELDGIELVTDSKGSENINNTENTSLALMKTEEANRESSTENREETNIGLPTKSEILTEDGNNETNDDNSSQLESSKESLKNQNEAEKQASGLVYSTTAVAASQDASTTNISQNENASNELNENRSEDLTKLPAHSSSKNSGTLYFYNQEGPIAIPPLLIGSQLKPTKFDQPKERKNKKQKTQKPGQYKSTVKNNNDYKGQGETEKLKWSASLNYRHDWPIENSNFLPQSNMLSIKGGVNWKRWDLDIGIGLQSDETTAVYEFLYSSYDSVGFFYDIDYYETIPGNPDSIIIHYTINPVFDTVSHSSVEEYSQNSRWVVVPITIAYEILQKESYVLKVGISAKVGWEYYREMMVPSNFPQGIGTSYQQIGVESVSPFITLGFGLENQIKIYDKWWFIIEPQLYYNMKTPYKWDGSKATGPLGFGINTGIKFKF